MKAPNEPMQQMMNVKSIKAFITDLKAQISQITQDDPEYDSETDILMATIENLEQELKNVKEIHDLPIREQARIVADFTFLIGAISEEEEQEYEDEDDDFEDDEEEYESEEEEDDQ